MALVADAKTVGAPFANSVEVVRAVWDFAEDAGGTGDLTVLTAASDCVVFLKYALVQTAVTSGGSMTFDLGKGAAGNELINDKAVASLTLDSLHVGAAPVELTAGEIINFQIDTAAATAGKVEFVFEIIKK